MKGIASAAPFLVVEIPETFIANFKHSLISIFFSNPEAKAPLNASPAPVVSKTLPFTKMVLWLLV